VSIKRLTQKKETQHIFTVEWNFSFKRFPLSGRVSKFRNPLVELLKIITVRLIDIDRIRKIPCVKMTIFFWDVAPCSLVDNDGRFRDVYRFHCQGDRCDNNHF
jgi:hypothetical protein